MKFTHELVPILVIVILITDTPSSGRDEGPSCQHVAAADRY